MGWGRFLLLGNLGQQLDLSDQQREMDDLRDELRRMRRSDANTTTLAELRAENDELRLYLTALTRLVATQGVVTREELEQVETQRGLPPSRVGPRPSRYGGRR